jgi:hypothetical protein
MANETTFTPEEWQRVEAAPFMAGLAVSYADMSSKVGIADEAAATGKAITAGASSASEIVRTLADRFARGERPTIPGIPNKPADAQVALILACEAASALVAAKAPAEADAYAQFLLDVASAAAVAAREGGFIGVGIRKLSEGEERVLAALALALRLPKQGGQQGSPSQ